MACPVCGCPAASSHVVKEMMFGTREEFVYHECSGCGGLHLHDIPDDLGRYYPDGYYSMAARAASTPPRPKVWLKSRRLAHTLGQTSLLGALLVRSFGRPAVPDWLMKLGLSPEMGVRI